jgi:hypothetical protein
MDQGGGKRRGGDNKSPRNLKDFLARWLTVSRPSRRGFAGKRKRRTVLTTLATPRGTDSPKWICTRVRRRSRLIRLILLAGGGRGASLEASQNS